MQINRLLITLSASIIPFASTSEAAEAGQAPSQTNGAVSRWAAAAEKGEAWACFNLGLAYHLGKDIQKNEAEAVKWYRVAAEKGFAAAQANLAYCYETGSGVPVDIPESINWYRMAALQGHPYAQYNLGKKYQSGPGVPIDPKMAENWFKLAAQRNFVPAYFSLGQIYANDPSGNANYREAFKWFRMAADQGYAPAQHAIGYLYFEGKGVLTNHVEAVEWYKRAASMNFPDSQYNLAICYEEGLGVPQNLTVAVSNYRAAADFGHPSAQYRLGVCYYQGKGVAVDFLQAYKWWNWSAVGGIGPPYKASQGVPAAASSKEILTRLMTESQIAEGQRLSKEFVPRQSIHHESPALVATPSADGSEIKRIGTGFLISTNGFLLTTFRTVASATNIHVITEGGSFNAVVARTDALSDIALLKLKVAGAFQPVPLVQSRESAIDNKILALGFDAESQGQFNPKAAWGKITALLGFQADPRQISLEPHLAASFAGAAVVNPHGQVIGMLLAGVEGARAADAPDSNSVATISYALKSDHLINFLRGVSDVKATIEEPKSEDGISTEEVQSRVRAATALILIL